MTASACVYVAVTDPDFRPNAFGGILDDGTIIKGDVTQFCRTHSSTLCARWAARRIALEHQAGGAAETPVAVEELVHIRPPEELFVPTDEGFASFQAWLEVKIAELRAEGVNPDQEGYYQIKIGDGRGAACAWCCRGAKLCGPQPCDDRKRWVDMRNLMRANQAAIAKGINDAKTPASEILAPVNQIGRG